MAGSGKRGGDERVLESRHLVGLFLGRCAALRRVLYARLCDGADAIRRLVHAAEAVRTPLPSARPSKPNRLSLPPRPAPANGEWDFYSKKNEQRRLAARAEAVGIRRTRGSRFAAPARPAPPAAAKTVPASARFQAPRMSKDASCCRSRPSRTRATRWPWRTRCSRSDFRPSWLRPTSDNFYRVQVGPYSDVKAAEAAKNALDRAGFKAIIKR